MANIHLSYNQFKAIFGDLGGFVYTMYNWSSGGKCNAIANTVKEAGYDVNARVSDELYNHITETINIWDEETESGRIDATTGANVVDNAYLRSKNYIPVQNNKYYVYLGTASYYGTRLYCYDKDKNYLGYTDATLYSTPIILTLLNNTAYVRFYITGTTYNNDVCINVSNPYINGNYFPYFTGQKFLVLVQQANLGDYNYTYNATYKVFYTIIADKLNDKNNSAYCSKYYIIASNPDGLSQAGDALEDMQGAVSKNTSNPYIYIKDYNYIDTTAFKNANNGVLLNYQLATPVLVDIV